MKWIGPAAASSQRLHETKQSIPKFRWRHESASFEFPLYFVEHWSDCSYNICIGGTLAQLDSPLFFQNKEAIKSGSGLFPVTISAESHQTKALHSRLVGFLGK